MKNVRKVSFGQGHGLTILDKFGAWLSKRKIESLTGASSTKNIADIGCGFYAKLSRQFIENCSSLTLVDVAIDNSYRDLKNVKVIEGVLPSCLSEIADESFDIILCNNVLEHLEIPLPLLKEGYRLLKSGGVLFVNVPSWRGKYFLEMAAFKLNLAPEFEMNDHKMYYDLRDLWPLLVQAGFLPKFIKVSPHKFGLNTYAVCRK